MEKDFDEWNKKKKALDKKMEIPYFKEGDVWWVHIGLNIGTESNGKGSEFIRPMLILKKFNHFSFLGIPLSTTKTVSNYRIPIGLIYTKESTINVSQMKNIDSRRLIKKICRLNKIILEDIKTKASRVIFG